MNAIDITYEDVLPMLRSQVHKQRSKFGGEMDELLSDCGLHFVETYNKWQGRRGNCSYKTYLWHTINNRFIDAGRKKNRQPTTVEIQEGDKVTERSWLTDLSEDARTIVQLICDTDGLNEEKGKARDKKNLLRSMLRGIGWSAERIGDSFLEIVEALQS